MYLSRLFLNPRSRQVCSEVARPYQMHKTILRAFPDNLPADERVLFRLEEHPRTGMLMALVQSQSEPNWQHLSSERATPYLLPESQLPSHLQHNPDTKQITLQFQTGQRLAFRLYAKSTKKIKVEGKKNGRRVELYKEEDQHKWLERKFEAAGASLLGGRVAKAGKVKGKQNRSGERNELTFFGVRFNGVLQVADPEKLQHAINNGIGSGKGIGFGLLSVAPAS